MDKWMILVAGVGTVFVALIGLILMLGLLRRIFGTKKGGDGSQQSPVEPGQLGPIVPPRETSAVPKAGSELVAVIAAAVAAASGVSPASFRITSIDAVHETRDGFNTPVWGRIERLSKN